MERKAGHNKLYGVASPSEAQDGNGSRVKGLDCFVQETFEISKALCFSSKKPWYAAGERLPWQPVVAMKGKKRRLMLNILLRAISGFFFEFFS